jgi:hypothetical protein
MKMGGRAATASMTRSSNVSVQSASGQLDGEARANAHRGEAARRQAAGGSLPRRLKAQEGGLRFIANIEGDGGDGLWGLSADFTPSRLAQPLASTGLEGNFGFHAGGYMETCNKPSISSCSGVGVLF